MRRLALVFAIVLAVPAVAATAVKAPHGAIAQLPKTKGCLLSPESQLNGCGRAKGTIGLYMVAMSRDGRNAYAPAQYSEGISAYRRSARTGALTQLGCLAQDDSQCTKGNGMHGAFWAQVAPDGRHVYLTASDDSSIVTLRRDAATGRLTELGCQINATGAQNPSKGCAPVRGFNTPREFALTPDGRFVYVTTFTTNGVAAFARDPASGALTQLDKQAGCVKERGGSGCAKGTGLSGPTGLAVSPDAKHVYVTSFRGNGLVEFARDPTTGALSELGCFNTGAKDGCRRAAGLRGAYGVTVSPDGRSVYVASRANRALAIFRRSAASGRLTQPRGRAGCVSDAGGGCAAGRGLYGARGVEVSRDSRFVYVGAYSADAVSIFARNPATGAVRQLAGAAGCVSNALGKKGRPTTAGCARGRGLNGAWGVTISPDGKHLYAGAQINNGLAVFARKR